jgi:hypothetical protein
MACCSLRDGVHDANCGTLHETALYRCIGCDAPARNSDMDFGRCAECAAALINGNNVVPFRPAN